MRTLACLLLVGVLAAQNLPSGKSRQPEIKVPFHISYHELPHTGLDQEGQIVVQFEVNEEGNVVNPEIVDTFNTDWSQTIIDKVMAIEFEPALQNGRPVQISYNLPILFK